MHSSVVHMNNEQQLSFGCVPNHFAALHHPMGKVSFLSDFEGQEDFSLQVVGRFHVLNLKAGSGMKTV